MSGYLDPGDVERARAKLRAARAGEPAQRPELPPLDLGTAIGRAEQRLRDAMTELAAAIIEEGEREDEPAA